MSGYPEASQQYGEPAPPTEDVPPTDTGYEEELGVLKSVFRPLMNGLRSLVGKKKKPKPKKGKGGHHAPGHGQPQNPHYH